MKYKKFDLNDEDQMSAFINFATEEIAKYKDVDNITAMDYMDMCRKYCVKGSEKWLGIAVREYANI